MDLASRGSALLQTNRTMDKKRVNSEGAAEDHKHRKVPGFHKENIMLQFSNSRSVKKRVVKTNQDETRITKVIDKDNSKEVVGEDDSDRASSASMAQGAKKGVSGCACKYDWKTNWGTCPNGYCCNPDGFDGGNWCVVETSCLARGWDLCAPRVTKDGCVCKHNWQTSAGKCGRYCCNVDNDPGGDWCLTRETSCVRGRNWGYCR